MLEGLRDNLRRNFEVHTTTDAGEGLRMLRADRDGYAVVVSDMRMPGMYGSEFLREARRTAPNTVRMLLDTYHEPFESGGLDGTPSVGARVLRIVVDYDALESEGATDTVALGALRTRGAYDPALLDALARVQGVGHSSVVVHEVCVAELETGMTLADDVRNCNGGLLVARGQRVTEQLAERLANLGSSFIREPLLVLGPEQAD